MEHTASFGYWLRRRRKALDLTQADLARQVGCSLHLIQKIEADSRRPSRQVAERLAACLAIELPEERDAFVQAARAEQAVGRLSPPPTTPISLQGDVAPFPSVRGYTLAEQIGSGGFGTVYRAAQNIVGREVAIKVVRPKYASQSAFIRRFEVEAQLVARLEHLHAA